MDYLKLAQEVVAQAAQSGAEVEVIITESKETEIRIQNGDVQQLSQSGSHGMGVRVIQFGQMGYAYTSDFSDASIEQTWKTAVDLSKVATPDPFRKLPEPQSYVEEDLGILDPHFQQVTVDQKIDALRRTEKAALDYHQKIIMSNFCSYGDAVEYTYLANSKGFSGSYGRTVCYAYLMAIARDDDGSMVNAMGMGVANAFSDLQPEVIGAEAGRKTISILGGKPVATQTASIVLDHMVGAQILGAIAAALSAEAWQKKRSFLLDRLGKEVGSSMVTIMDNGRMKGGIASAPFDGEGVPTRATRLIDEGVLQNLMYDSYTAAKEGRESTGNAGRSGHQSLPGLAPSNFYMQPGHKSVEELIKGVEKGLYVLSVMQTGGIDPVNGDCSMAANGLWIENGKIVGPVGGVTIATTLDGFLQHISDVADDLRQVPMFGAIGVPTLRVDQVTIGGV
jgi:PmbA protein